MNKRKKLLATVLALIMCVSAICNAFALVTFADDGDSLIKSFKAKFAEGATKNASNDYVWTPSDSVKGHMFMYRISCTLSGADSFEAGEIEIRMPKTILVDREGQQADRYDLSVPAYNDAGLTDDVEFVYHEDLETGELVVTNRRSIPGGWSCYVEIGYITTETTFNYADYMSTGTTYPKGGSAPFEASVTVTHDGVTDTEEAEAEPVYIDTSARLTSMTQSQKGTLIRQWDPAWGTKPNDAEGYYYLVWTIESKVSATQPYDFTIGDTFTAGAYISADGVAGFAATDLTIVGYKFSGQSQYQPDNTDHASTVVATGSKTRYDYVLTKLPKAVHDRIIFIGVDNVRTSYILNNKTLVTLAPIDGHDDPTLRQSSDSFKYERKLWNPPGGQFNSRVYGVLYSGYLNMRDDSESFSSYLLTDFKAGSEDNGVNEMPNLRFYSFVWGNPYEWTVGDVTGDGKVTSADINNANAYGLVPVRVTMANDKFNLPDPAETPLTAADYEIHSIKPAYSAQSATFDSDPEVMEYKTRKVTDFTDKIEGHDIDVMDIYLTVSGLPAPVKVATFHMADESYTDVNTTYVADSSTKELILKPDMGVTGYRLDMQTRYYYFEYGAYVNVTLKRTANVLDKIGTGTRTRLTDNSEVHIYADYITPNDDIWDKDTFADDYIIGIEPHGHLDKTVSGYSNDKIKKQLSVSWQVQAYEDYFDTDGLLKKTEQASGVIYDLLPAGAVLKMDSVQVYADGKRLYSGSYTLTPTDNYQNTGRTLLTITFPNPAKVYKVYYTTVHTWDMLHDFSKDLVNAAVYETGNEKIGDGQLVSAMLSTIPGLTSAEGGKRFISKVYTYHANVTTMGSIGLTKRVSTINDPAYTNSAVVMAEDEYAYMIRFATDQGQQATDLILYDSIENYTAGGLTSGWHGTLKKVDLSGLASLTGVQPKVYYSTVSGLAIPSSTDLANDEIWVAADDYDVSQLAEVKAIAVDLRHTATGNYIMPANTGASVRIVMEAPDELPGTNAYAYNEAYINSAAYDSGSGTADESKLIDQGYTKTALYIAGNVDLKKVVTEDPTTPISGAVFRLYGTSVYGTVVDMRAVSEADGGVHFERVEAGTYLLEEVSLETTDYFLNEHIWSVQVVSRNTTLIDELEQTPYVITDKTRIHGDLTLHKLGEVDYSTMRISLKGTTFRLEGTSDYGTEYALYGATGENGMLTFADIERGTYTLTELIPTEDYRLPDDNTWTVVCDSTGIVYIDGRTAISGYFDIINQPYHELNFKKLDSFNAYKTVTGAVFTLKGTSDKGTVVDMTAVSDQFGTVSFGGLEEGTYVLQEIEAPANYQLDDEPYVVSIDADGNVTGLTALSEVWDAEDANLYPGYCAILNDRVYNGTIEITKEWENDTGKEADRPIPVIDLSNTDPLNKKPTATILLSAWRTLKDRDATVVSVVKEATVFKKSATGTAVPADAVRIDDMLTEYPVYSWYDSVDSTWYWWSDAEIVFLPNSCQDLFSYLENLASVDLSGLSSAKVTNMYGMFRNCKSLTSVDFLHGLDVSSVNNMSYMFENCSGLESVDLSGWNVSRVLSMQNMFYGCTRLRTVDLSGWDTFNVSRMANMFYGDSALTTIYVSESWSIEKVATMDSIFTGCTSLVGKSRVGTSEEHQTAYDSTKKGVTYARIDSADAPGLLTYKAYTSTNAAPRKRMAQIQNPLLRSYVNPLTTTSFRRSDTPPAEEMNARNIAYNSSMPEYQGILGDCPVYLWQDGTTAYWYSEADTVYYNGSAGSMDGFFYGMSALTSVDLSGLDFSRASLNAMFYGCSSLTSIDFSGLDMSHVGSITMAFAGCSSLTSVNLGNLYGPALSSDSLRTLFRDCSSLETIYTDGSFVIPNAVDTMFNGCTKLVGGRGTAYDAATFNAAYARPDEEGKPGYFTLAKQAASVRQSNSEMYTGDLSESGNVYDQWIDNGNGTWTYRFKVFDEDMTYYVWEEEMPGYTTDETDATPVKVEYKAGEDGHAVVTNKKEVVPTAGLIVSKTVTGDGATRDDRNKEFHFTITVTGLADGTYGQMEFVEGVAQVTLKHNESVFAEEIPAGLTYEVVETDGTGYTVTPAAGYAGTFEEGDIVKASFTNEKTAPDVGSLKVIKTLWEGTSDQLFTFTVTLTGEDIPAQLLCGSHLFQDGVCQIKVKAGEFVIIEGIPAGYHYDVEEIVPDGFTLVSENGENGTIIENEVAEASFVNEKLPVPEPLTGKVTILAKIDGAESDDEFTFNVFLTDLEPNKTYTMSDGTTFTADKGGIATVVVKLGQNESVTFELPENAHYTVTELASGKYTASYTAAVKTPAGYAEFEGKANTERNQDLSTNNEKLEAETEILIAFTNTPERTFFGFGKEDEDNSVLAGARLQILGENGTVLYDWISSDEMKQLELAPGSYSLHEEKAPDGYAIAEDIPFTIVENAVTGMLEIQGSSVLYIVMQDEPGFKIVHSSDMTVEVIPMSEVGANGYDITAKVYEGFLYGGLATDEDFDTAITGMNGKRLNPKKGDTYYLREVSVNYLRPANISVQRKKTDTVIERYMMTVIDADGFNYQFYTQYGFLYELPKDGTVITSFDTETGTITTGPTEEIYSDITAGDDSEYKNVYSEMSNQLYRFINIQDYAQNTIEMLTPDGLFDGATEDDFIGCLPYDSAKGKPKTLGESPRQFTFAYSYCPYYVTADGVLVIGDTQRYVQMTDGELNIGALDLSIESKTYECTLPSGGSVDQMKAASARVCENMLTKIPAQLEEIQMPTETKLLRTVLTIDDEEEETADTFGVDVTYDGVDVTYEDGIVYVNGVKLLDEKTVRSGNMPTTLAVNGAADGASVTVNVYRITTDGQLLFAGTSTYICRDGKMEMR